MASIYAKSERLKYFVELLIRKYEIKCHFCGEILDGIEFFRRKAKTKRDNMTWHHVDENRANDYKDNLVLAHRTCHLKYHRQKELMERKSRYEEIMRRLI
jgi:hypothetical protein